MVVVLDPVDGSTNASRGIPWFATSLCAVDASGPRASVVVNQASGVRFEAVRGGGARRDGTAIRASSCTELGRGHRRFLRLSGPIIRLEPIPGLGAAALDLCAVAEGVLDGYAVVGGSELGSWDYLGGMLICTEAGGGVVDSQGNELVTLVHGDRRTPVAAATPVLLDALLTAAESP